jgi:hypothetical protein
MQSARDIPRVIEFVGSAEASKTANGTKGSSRLRVIKKARAKAAPKLKSFDPVRISPLSCGFGCQFLCFKFIDDPPIESMDLSAIIGSILLALACSETSRLSL